MPALAFFGAGETSAARRMRQRKAGAHPVFARYVPPRETRVVAFAIFTREPKLADKSGLGAGQRPRSDSVLGPRRSGRNGRRHVGHPLAHIARRLLPARLADQPVARIGNLEILAALAIA